MIRQKWSTAGVIPLFLMATFYKVMPPRYVIWQSAHLVQLLLQHSWVLLDLLHELAHQLIDESGTHWELVYSHPLMWLARIICRLRQQHRTVAY